MSLKPLENQQISQFLKGEKNLATPFDLVLTTPTGRHCFHCSEVLRLLPSKRIVLRANSDGQQQVVIKLFAPVHRGEREYNRELRGHTLATSAGVNVPDLISSYTDIAGCYGVVYDFLEDAQTFSDENVRKSQENVDKLLQLIAKMHNYGIYQDDIHLDNILLKNNDLFVIDLGSVLCEQEEQSLSKRKSIKNLARLVAQFYPIEQEALIQSLEIYYQERNWEWSDSEHYHFSKKLKIAGHKRKGDYLKKCFRNCTMTSYGHTFSIEYAFRSKFLQNGSIDFINKIDQLMSDGEILKAGNSVTVVLVTIGDQQVVIKRYNIKSFWHFLRRCWRPSRAVVSWRNANLLEFINLPTLKPIGFIERRIGWFRHTAYFISDYSESEQLLDVYQRRQPTDDELEQIKTIFALLQAQQISHGDLKAQNLLIDKQGKITLIDLDAMREHKCQHSFQRAFNKDIKRFIRNWQDAKIKQLFTSHIF